MWLSARLAPRRAERLFSTFAGNLASVSVPAETCFRDVMRNISFWSGA
jgi:hypothetical protein